MSNQSDVKRVMIIGVSPAGASVSGTAILVDVSRTTVSRIITAYTHLSSVPSVKRKSVQKLKLKGSERWVMKGIVTRQDCTVTENVKMNIHLQNLVFMKTMQREPHTANIYDKVAIPKALASTWNAGDSGVETPNTGHDCKGNK
ncbi:transposable element Tc1 transposase [Trichonephila clavipes]|nr:transposable element Tc1 transposase [Trichonephila clavipes]